jgi:hypothetical protein
MHHPGVPDELVGVVGMASNASSYLTGALVNINGGVLAGGVGTESETEVERDE